MRSRFPALRGLLLGEEDSLDELTMRADETIGRPRGDAAFLRSLEKKTGRPLAPGKRGPKAKARKDK